jgi:hypothetical protein
VREGAVPFESSVVTRNSCGSQFLVNRWLQGYAFWYHGDRLWFDDSNALEEMEG